MSTLKEKFDELSCKDCDMPYCENKCTFLTDWELNKLEQISDDYAIEFAEWLSKEEYGLVFWEKYNTSKNLLEIFKKEKGL